MFSWTQDHRTGAELAPWRTRGDPCADAYVADARPTALDDCLAQITMPGTGPVALATRRAFETEPPWADWASVARGQNVFVRLWPAASAALFFTSLVGGFSAPLITEVVCCTGYLTGAGKATQRRLFETFQMVVDTALSGEHGMRSGGDGWAAVLRVRLLHAKVRRRLLDRGSDTKDKAGSSCVGSEHGRQAWDTKVFGVPINQEDMAVTLLAFSINVIDGIELVQGWPL